MIDKSRLRLAKGEKVIEGTRLSGVAFFVGQATSWLFLVVLLAVGAVFIFSVSSSTDFTERRLSSLAETWAWLAWFGLVFLGLLSTLITYLNYYFTRVVITTRRVIRYSGWIGRYEEELFFHKVESVDTSQGLFGRGFGYGTIVACGTGGEKMWLSDIPNHTDFVKNMEWAVMEYQKSKRS